MSMSLRVTRFASRHDAEVPFQCLSGHLMRLCALTGNAFFRRVPMSVVTHVGKHPAGFVLNAHRTV
jgi:hypothetical protein